MSTTDPGLRAAPIDDQGGREVLSREALEFLAALHRRFGARRDELLAARRGRGRPRGLPEETRAQREGGWTVAPPRPDYGDRRVEITGPVDRKLVVSALRSGARGFMADFEDATSPTWAALIRGQANVADAADGTIAHVGADGERRTPDGRTTLIVRPRGLHLPERHLTADGAPVAGALVDAGLFLFHGARALLDRGHGVYLYLPKLEHHLEARWWNNVLGWCERELGLPEGCVRPTVLIETLPAAFQMDEILWELQERSYGLNAGRWDYLFSAIKTLADDPAAVLPDRGDVTMTAPFMRAYCERLVATCHRRGAFAIGGMSALIPSRTDAAANARALAAVAADKRREAGDGFDGSWVAHPDLVPVAQAAFDEVLGARPHQIDRRRDDVTAAPAALLEVGSARGAITAAGLRNDVSVAVRYLSAWLTGRGAVAIDGLMEDAATAEICRAQLWQWIRHGVRLDDGRVVTRALVTRVLDDVLAEQRAALGPDGWRDGRMDEVRALVERLALADELEPFLTSVAYDQLEP
ncbi:malate synthase A [Patulibacter defluvii]|uniref:malate synthase A n=1 Tax=Patulibacter defluvii TaxID=3095358 RepID=UPI002A766505|nr:malate synthase A [Patulibacter sp. DM4]